MNFLAHLFLAEPTPESRMGNLLGDFVKGRPWDDRFETVIWKGIMEHRHIDSYTDRHPVWQQSRKLLDPGRRRFAGIVIDIFYDHFLTLHWSTFSPDLKIEDFVSETYTDLRKARRHAPTDAYEVIHQMMEENWLQNYGTVEGIRETMHRVSERSENLALMHDATDELETHFKEMEGHFLEFFPDMIRFISDFRRSGKNR